MCLQIKVMQIILSNIITDLRKLIIIFFTLHKAF